MGKVQRVRRLVLAAVAAALVAVPGTAHAATPCRDQVYNEWYATGKVSTRHPIACYRDALRHIPADAAVYSDLDSSIKQALQAALARLHSKDPSRVPSSVGTGLGRPRGPHGTKGAEKTKVGRNPSLDRMPRSQTVAQQPVASSSGGGLPLPIIVLGGVAVALAAAGAVGTGVRYLRRH